MKILKLKRYKASTSKKGGGHLGDSKDVLIDSELNESTKQKPPVKKRTSLDYLSSEKQLQRRTKEMYDKLKRYAEDEGIGITRILGLLLSYSGTSDTSDVSDYGWKLWRESSLVNKTKVPVATSLAIYCDSNLGRVG